MLSFSKDNTPVADFHCPYTVQLIDDGNEKGAAVRAIFHEHFNELDALVRDTIVKFFCGKLVEKRDGAP